jgi:hypothetical protein
LDTERSYRPWLSRKVLRVRVGGLEGLGREVLAGVQLVGKAETALRDVSQHDAYDGGGRTGTYGTGRDKIDHLLLSPALFDRVQAVGVDRRIAGRRASPATVVTGLSLACRWGCRWRKQ